MAGYVVKKRFVCFDFQKTLYSTDVLHTPGRPVFLSGWAFVCLICATGFRSRCFHSFAVHPVLSPCQTARDSCDSR